MVQLASDTLKYGLSSDIHNCVVDFISEMAPLIKRLILRYFDSRFKGLTLLPTCDNEQINSFGTITTYTRMRLLQ